MVTSHPHRLFGSEVKAAELLAAPAETSGYYHKRADEGINVLLNNSERALPALFVLFNGDSKRLQKIYILGRKSLA